jgi:dinuclear metal center YbgI/SA1388 family protein
MILRQDLVRFLDDLLLAPCNCEDASNNGLQVEGRPEVRRVVFGVDACAALFEAAAARNADFVVVHHGLSWRDSLKYLTGVTARRVGLLFNHGMSLYAAHLPLDQHPEVGHNAVIARRLGLAAREPFFKYGGAEIGIRGALPKPMGREALVATVNKVLHAESTLGAFGPEEITTVGVVSGGGTDAVAECARLGIECLVTGELTHTHYHTALESTVNVIAAGHYRSEVPGLEAVMQRLRESFELHCELADLPTGY